MSEEERKCSNHYYTATRILHVIYMYMTLISHINHYKADKPLRQTLLLPGKYKRGPAELRCHLNPPGSNSLVIKTSLHCCEYHSLPVLCSPELFPWEHLTRSSSSGFLISPSWYSQVLYHVTDPWVLHTVTLLSANFPDSQCGHIFRYQVNSFSPSSVIW